MTRQKMLELSAGLQITDPSDTATMEPGVGEILGSLELARAVIVRTRRFANAIQAVFRPDEAA